jgi:hypothetical protein
MNSTAENLPRGAMVGFVYAIGDDQKVKIGWSTDPLKRLNAIRCHCPSKISLLGLIPASMAQEVEVQQLLAPWRINSKSDAGREWFHHFGPVAAFVTMLPKPKISAIETAPPPSVDSVDGVIEALGGSAAVRKRYHVSSQVLWHWCAKGHFPPDCHAAMDRDLTERGYDAPSSLWGQRKSKE